MFGPKAMAMKWALAMAGGLVMAKGPPGTMLAVGKAAMALQVGASQGHQVEVAVTQLAVPLSVAGWRLPTLRVAAFAPRTSHKSRPEQRWARRQVWGCPDPAGRR